ncbi:glycoside hydrolase family 99-like domain-containing protein [uncultured Fibrobacter sp.]|uniref:glycosyltransferase WbsX family protein n=1 Tax=uncultured Fibrobacter sp. TaxID=261512 RepID=UPI0025EB2D83|nr:glycoside hydrolase family 99-like domain-containing protein [uncultured Fibrobacter sp.]
MKYIAFYLPQFHELPENNKIWGKGFTEWTNVKNAKPLFDGHHQPVVPLNHNYYDLTHPSVMKWQIDLAKKYGIYGFCFYHYWYNGHIIMNKPIEMLLGDKSMDIPFCICWANHEWSNAWKTSKKKEVYFSQDYSDKGEWRTHYEYLLPYLKDVRYIRIEDKPLVVIYDAEVPQMKEMLKCWNDWAIQDGIEKGLTFAYENVMPDISSNFDDSPFDFDIEYQPQYYRVLSVQKKRYNSFADKTKRFIENKLKLSIPEWFKELFRKDVLTRYSYDEAWKWILNMKPVSPKSVPGAFVNVDTTPRRQERGVISIGMTPEKLEKYLIQLVEKTKNEYKRDMIFVFAWNEWAEGAYMEPDERWKYGVLEAFKNSLIKTGEMPK